MTRVLALLLLTTVALAGEQITREQWKWDLRDDATGTPIKGADGKPIRTDDETQCEAAGAALRADQPSFTYRCTTTVRFTASANCDGVPKPALTTFTVLDADAVVYKGPYCAPGETCSTPEGWNDVSFTYTDVGGLRLNDDGTTDEYVLTQGAWPTCWEWKWQRVPDPVPVANEGEGFVPPLDPDALDGENEI